MSQARSVEATFGVRQYRLTLTKAGGGSGTVTSSPSGISCGPNCSQDTYDYNAGTEVTLSADPSSGSNFGGWSGGGCSGNGTCTVTMSQARTVTATFNLGQYRLTVRKAGNGSGYVTSTPAGISCGPNCLQDTYDYDAGTEVTLAADPTGGASFGGWSGGGCSGTGTCTVTMSQARTVTASFNYPEAPVISNISHQYLGPFDYCVFSGGEYLPGYRYYIRFDYTDTDGDVTADAEAYATTTTSNSYNFYLGTSFVSQSGDGFSGTLRLDYCNLVSSVTVDVTLTDGSGRTSNTLSRHLSP
jgi:hypothetical protein